VPVAGAEQSDAVRTDLRDDPGGEDAATLPLSAASLSSRCFISSNTFMPVSSLCTTCPCAAWISSASSTGQIGAAVSATCSHCTEAGRGMPAIRSRLSSRAKGIPLPYLSSAISTPTLRSYLRCAAAGGAGAEKTLPQVLQRSRSHS
jgi:hypothetical protein